MSGYGHLGQIMACAGQVVKKLIANAPEIVTGLSEVNLEFLRWLIQKYGGERAFLRWVDILDNPARHTLLKQKYEDFYPTDSRPPDMQGQIEELVTLSRRLGFQGGVVVLIDLRLLSKDNDELRDHLKALFGRLPMFEHQGFVIKAALPETLVDALKLVDLTRGRVAFARLSWQRSECRQIADRLIRIATRPSVGIDALATRDLLHALEDEVEKLFGTASPRGWTWLAETILTTYVGTGRRLTSRDFQPLLRKLFTDHVPLTIDRSHQSVWRGPQKIPLEEQPFRLLERLWQFHGSSYEANDALLEVTGSRANLNTIASRLRQKIEPVPGDPIYLRNSRGRGYWLENTRQPDDSFV